jgi:hypothetical protein
MSHNRFTTTGRQRLLRLAVILLLLLTVAPEVTFAADLTNHGGCQGPGQGALHHGEHRAHCRGVAHHRRQ